MIWLAEFPGKRLFSENYFSIQTLYEFERILVAE